MFEKIEFKGQPYIFVGGAITTKEDFENGRASFAHLHDDGNISRFGTIIGTKEDITFTGKKVKAYPKVTVGEMLGEDWSAPLFF